MIGYLGKQFNFEHEDYVSVTAPKFVNGVLDFYNVTDFADYPHSPDMRVVNDLPRLESSKAAMLYSLAYKTLYLAKSYRFDMLPISQFLTTRVQFSTEQDMSKALNSLAYLNSTKDFELRLNAKQRHRAKKDKK